LEIDEIALEILTRYTGPAVNIGEDLSIKVFDDHDFYIELLVCTDSTSAIRQHVSSGAIRVLRGSAIHSRFRFDGSQPPSCGLRFGQVNFLGAELLSIGDVRPIQSGPESLHAMFHIGVPFVALVIRTHCDARLYPPATVLRPHAILDDSLLDDAQIAFAAQSLQVLARHDPARARSFFNGCLSKFDMPRVVALCISLGRLNLARSLEVEDVVARSFGDEGSLFAACLSVQRQLICLEALGKTIVGPFERLPIALIAIVPSRSGMEYLCREAFGIADVYPHLATVLDNLMRRGGFSFRLAEGSALHVLTATLRHRNKVAFWEAMDREFEPSSIREHRPMLEGVLDAIRSNELLRYLYDDA
jgi:hypothetical protein